MTNRLRQTSISEGIAAGLYRELRDHYDRMCKRLLSEKEILGWILHECLDEFKSVEPHEIASRYIEGNPEVSSAPVHADSYAASRVEGMNSEDASIDEGTVWYDIRFRALVPNSRELIGMIVNVEAQGVYNPGYPLLKRAMYYCGRMISSQRGQVFSGSDYQMLQKVCSIWICPQPPTDLRNTITSYSVAEHNLVGTARNNKAEYDLLEIVLVCPDGDRQKKGDGLLRLLGTLIASERSVDERKSIITEEFGIPMTERLSEEVSELGSWLSKGLEDEWERRGLEIGLKQGIEQGIQQGIEQGIQQGIVQGIEQGIVQGIEQGTQQGIEQGRAQSAEAIARLASILSDQHRLDELPPALEDPQSLASLMEEFGITYD